MEPTIHQHVRSSLRDSVYTNLATGLGESYFAAFMLALGLSETISGAGKIIPMFIGVCVQLFAIRGPFRRLGLRLRAVSFVIVQALTFPLLAFLGLYRLADAPIVLGLLAVYWAAGLSSQPPWNRLIGETVPTRYRLKFFALRNAWGQFAVLLGLVSSGALLAIVPKHEQLPVFVGIFLLCGLLKVLSARALRQHRDAPLAELREEHVGFRDFARSLRRTEQGKLVRFLFAWYVVVQIAGVYFDPYMLGYLGWSPVKYTGVIATSFVGRILILRWLRSRTGPRQMSWVLFFGCVGIAATPLWWSISQFYPWILVGELMCGASWGAFELATVLLYFERIKDEERTSIMTYIAFSNTLGMVIGVAIGAALLQNWPPEKNPYQAMFLLSSALRFIVLLAVPAIRMRDAWPLLATQARSIFVVKK
jgi:MFS family permease